MNSPPSALAKGACQHCLGRLEFHPAQAGSHITCPHCGQSTKLIWLRLAVEPIAEPASPAEPIPVAAAPEPLPEAGPRRLRYFSGGEVCLGDRVRYRGAFARVVFVSDGEHYAYAVGYEDYRGSEAGILICDDDGGTSLLHEEDENLELIHH